MNIKNFQKGETVWVVKRNIGRTEDAQITPFRIAKIGRKYLTLKEPHNAKFAEFDGHEYLLEVVSYGEARYLFPTEKAAKDFLEKRELERWLGRISSSSAGKYTLEQLRKVRAILVK